MTEPTPPTIAYQTIAVPEPLTVVSTQNEPLMASPSPCRDAAVRSSPPSNQRLPSPDDDSQPRKRQRTMSSTGTFPYFTDGDVIVSLKDSAKVHVWRLHSSTLDKDSAQIKEALKSGDSLTGKAENPEGIRFHLTLADPPQPPAIPLLIPCTLDLIPEDALTRDHSSLYRDFLSPSLPPSRDSSIPASVKVEEQDGRSTSQRPGSFDVRIQSEICSAYDNLFRHMYSLPLRLSTTVKVQHSLFQAEVMLPVFRSYGCLPSVRPHLGNLFSQYRHNLFEAISRDPCRWLNLSIPLESESIFTEAFVHLAGSFSRNVKQDNKLRISPLVLNRLKKKHEQLIHAQEKTIGELFRLTIHIEDRPVTMDVQLETWTAVQLFRDWIAVELDKIERRGAGNHRYGRFPASTSSHAERRGMGSLLRRIHRGGEEYLSYDMVLKGLKESHEFLGSEWEDLAEDLRSLKKFASKTVDNLCQNNLMLDPELYGIPYLTCVNVGKGEYPWLIETGER